MHFIAQLNTLWKLAYSEALEHEVRADGIHVSLVEPGYTKTLIGDNSAEADNKLPKYDEARSKIGKKM